MGGDHGPSVTLPACRAFLAAHPEAELVLVGRADALAQAAALAALHASSPRARSSRWTTPVEVALRRKKDSSMRVAINQVKGRQRRAGVRLGRQHRRADGGLALRAEDARRHRPPGDRARVLPNEQRRLHDRARPRRQRRLHGRAPAAVRRDGQRAGRRPSTARSGRRVGLLNIGEEDDQGQRDDQAGRRAAARGRDAATSTSTATSKATTSSRARPTSSSATASSAT